MDFVKRQGDKHMPLAEGDVLPVQHGGFGSTNVEQARTNIGLRNVATRDMFVSDYSPDHSEGKPGDFWLQVEGEDDGSDKRGDIWVIPNHAGGMTYKANPEKTTPGQFHQDGAGNWYYVAMDKADLQGKLNPFLASSPDSNQRFDVTDNEGVTRSISANQIVTSYVEDMSYMFSDAASFNQEIGGWDVSSVTNMYYMFYKASAFNADIGGWDVSSATNMQGLFFRASAFNQDIGEWDVSSVTNMAQLVSGASAFNQDLSGWCVELITSKPNQFDLSTTAWDKTDRQPLWGQPC